MQKNLQKFGPLWPYERLPWHSYLRYYFHSNSYSFRDLNVHTDRQTDGHGSLIEIGLKAGKTTG